MSSLILLVEKRDGRIKDRGCAAISKQRRQPGYKKEDAALPIVSNEGVTTTCAIKAHKKLNVACIDIPGAYLHALTDEEVTMLLKGPLAELMVMVDPKIYRKHDTHSSKGGALLYVKMNKAPYAYGLLKSALLFYKKLVTDLETYGFKVNPYDPWMANTIINCKQMTVNWHVYDSRVSHEGVFKITKFATYLSGVYGTQLTVHRGKVHKYLGMDLNHSKEGKVKVAMIKYLDKATKEFPEEIGPPAILPPAKYLFLV